MKAMNSTAQNPIRRNSAIALLTLGLMACGQDAPVEDIYKSSLYVFGTKVEISVRGTDAATLTDATTRLESEFKRMHKDWHAWKPGELVDINQALAVGQSHSISPFVKPLIVRAKSLYELSDGLFNPAIGGLVGAWGFHADEKPQGHKPDLAAIRALTAKHPSMRDVHLEGDTISSTNPTVQFDFGGFAKGVALDRAEEVLKELGISQALINAGGDINTLGGGGAQPWQVGIRDPKAWGLIATLDLLPGENVYTSGNYERFREIDGVRYAHIIDPRTGMPVDHIVSATVIGDNGAIADGAATALSVAGPQDWHRIAKKMGIKFAVLVDDAGTVYINPAMKARIKFAPDFNFTIVESPPL